MSDILLKFFQSGLGEVIKVLGIIATAAISVWSLIVNYKTLRRTTYINQITTLKAKYIESLRQHLAEYCAIAFECNKASIIPNYATEENRHALIKDVELKFYLITLFLNNEDEIDKKLSALLGEIRLAAPSRGDNGYNLPKTIAQLLDYSQQMLLFELRNLKEEAKHGPMSSGKINQVRTTFWKKHKDR